MSASNNKGAQSILAKRADSLLGNKKLFKIYIAKWPAVSTSSHMEPLVTLYDNLDQGALALHCLPGAYPAAKGFASMARVNF